MSPDAMLAQLFQVGVKLLFTLGLLLVIVLCGNEIRRLWWDRTLVLVPFDYSRNGEPAGELGQHFTRSVSLHLAYLQRLFAPDKGASNPFAVNADQTSSAPPISWPELRGQPLADVEIQAYGIPVTNIARAALRWVEAPNELVGSVSQSKRRIDVTAELRNSPLDLVRDEALPRWYFSQPLDDADEDASIDEASYRLACRIFRQLSTKQSALYGNISDPDFLIFTRALGNYKRYVDDSAEVSRIDEARLALKEAQDLIAELQKKSAAREFPPIFKLSGYVARAAGNRDQALTTLAEYMKLLEAQQLTDTEARKLLEDLQKEKQAAQSDAPPPTVGVTVTPPATVAPTPPSAGTPTPATVIPSPTLPPATPTVTAAQPALSTNLREAVRPVRPGLSVSSAIGTTGTICCIVRDASGALHVLSADHAFPGDVGTAVLQPGIVDGGRPTNQIGVLSRTAQARLEGGDSIEAAGAIARLLRDVGASPDVPGLGPIRGIATDLQPGGLVRAVGRTSGLVEGRVERTNVTVTINSGKEAQRFAGLIQTTKMSAGGDSGAPVLTDDGRLVGMVYAGSATTTLVMPIEPVLRALDVELVR